MKIFYNVDVQMMADHDMTDELVQELEQALGFTDTEIDEREEYMLVAIFNSETDPIGMRSAIQALLDAHHEIFYFDVIYRYEGEMITERFVLRNDGTSQNYVGRTVFEEVNDHE